MTERGGLAKRVLHIYNFSIKNNKDEKKKKNEETF